MKKVYFYTLSIILLFLAGCSTPTSAIPEQVEILQSLSTEDRVFALAYSNINGVDGFQEGADILISKLVDTNGDGEVSVGDTIIMGRYPTNFEASAFAEFGVKQHIITNVIGSNEYQINVSAGGASISFIAGPNREKYIETLNIGNTSETVDIFDNWSSGFFDTLVATSGSLSQPQEEIERTVQNLRGDDNFVDVDGSATCLAGSYGVLKCVPARAGTFVDSDGATEATLCPVGTFQDQTGQTSCKPAPTGTFVSYQGASAATACPAGQTTLFEGASSVANCIDPDTDNDGVSDAEDLCPDTNLATDVPASLKKNRYFVDSSGDFVDGNGNSSGYSIADAGGCSASQIIEEIGLGKGHKKFGISKGELKAWVASVP